MTTITLNPEVAFALLDNQPQCIVYYVPVWGTGTHSSQIIDFEIAYCNKEAAVLSNRSQSSLLGQQVNAICQPVPELQLHLFQQLLKVYESGQPSEEGYYNPLAGKHFGILRTKVADGVLTAAHDRTAALAEQEEKARQISFTDSILNTTTSAIFACEALRDSSGTIVDLEMKRINPAFTKMIGLSEANVVGNTYRNLFPASVENGTFALNCEVIETGVSTHKEMYYKGDHLDAWYDVSLSKLGKDGLLVSFSDVSEQKNAYLQIAQQKTLLDNILMHSANGISVTQVLRDASGEVIDGQTILANDAAVRFTGIPRDLYLGKRAVELEPNILQSPYFQMCLKTLDSGAPQFAQYFMESTQRWLEISISRLDTDHLITIFTDVTQNKEAQLQQEELVEALRRSNNNLEEFAHAASHDLKEPVRKVHFFMGQLKTRLDGRLNEEESRLFERVENATQRMQLLIDDLLEYSHVSSGARHLEEVNLGRKLNLVCSDLEILIQEKGATITAGALPTVCGYRRQLQQLFQNLISNSIKYSKPDVPPHIEISSRQVAGSEVPISLQGSDQNRLFHLIEVKDNGIGFEQSDADRIFNMFQRLHGKNEYSGTGLGLAIVRKVVANHNGYIWAESRPGAGATFKLLLPVADLNA